VAIIGGGIAGLNAAWKLRKAGIRATVYEAADRAGGRIWTDFGSFGPGITVEIGGEFIDSSHKEMRRLAREFKLELLDTAVASEAQLTETYFFGGRARTESEIVDAFRPVAKRIRQDQKNSVFNDYSDYNALAARLDNTTLEDYLRQVGAEGWLFDLLDVAYQTEFGRATAEQSALNFVTLVGTKPNSFSEFGESDQRYKIRGGNQQLVDRMAAALSDQVQLGQELIAARRTSNGIRLTFSGCGGHREVTADIVLLTLPFTTLHRVDLDLGLPARAKRGIREITYGTNSKLVLGYGERSWRGNGQSGLYFSDLSAQSGWDASQLQPGAAGAITTFLGGEPGLTLGHGSLSAHASRTHHDLDRIFPGTASKANGLARRFVWPDNPFALGSYTCFAPGQYTEFGGFYSQAFGDVYFAGEHCSLDAQGYMEGGAVTGAEAAAAIAARV
jgi:monoamine oxidase